jgi:hypothetical protein
MDELGGWGLVLLRSATDRIPADSAATQFIDLPVDGRTRLAVSGRVMRSAPHLGLLVDRLYRATLGRAPDAGARRFWIAQIEGGRRIESVRVALLDSDEYLERAVA